MPTCFKGLTQRYAGFLQRNHRAILVVWLFLAGLAAWEGPKLLKKSGMTVTAPPKSASVLANAEFTRYFPDEAKQSPVIVFLTEVNGQEIQPFLSNFTSALYCALFQPNQFPTLINASLFESYATFAARNLSALGQEFISADHAHSIISISVQVESGAQVSTLQKEFVQFLQSIVATLAVSTLPPNVSAQVTGDLVFEIDVQEGMARDLIIMDGVAFPIALLVLAFVLKSVRLLIIPVLNMATSILISFMIALPLTAKLPFVSYAPSLMMSVTIAMSIDYSLFTLSRYREELKKGVSVVNAVTEMLASAGHTILVSGLTLTVCFLGLVIFPVSSLRSPGVGTAIALLVTLTINLSVTPSMLLCFEAFFRRAVDPVPACCLASRRMVRSPPPSFLRSSINSSPDSVAVTRADQTHAQLDDEETASLLKPEVTTEQRIIADRRRSTRSHSGGLSDADELAALKKSVWYRLGTAVTSYPHLIVLVVLALSIPCGRSALSYRKTTSTTAFTPRNAVATQAYASLCDAFGPGRVFEYNLVIVPPPSVPILSAGFFQTIQELLLLMPGNFTYEGLIGVTAHNIDYTTEFLPCINSTIFGQQAHEACLLAASEFVSSSGNASYVQIQLAVDPFSELGAAWLQTARAYLDAASQTNGYKLFLANGAATALDAMTTVDHVFPFAVGATMLIVFVLVGLAFRSLLIPARAVLTLAITLSYVFGLAVYVYDDGIFNALQFGGLAGQGAICWITPIMAFTIVVGLGLDYDVFLLSRIVEYRSEGFSNIESIRLGLAQTGSIITYAGLIMATAFLGLLFSQEAVLNELSFILVGAVLLDTLLIRTILVPAIMKILGNANWWPGAMPIVSK